MSKIYYFDCHKGIIEVPEEQLKVIKAMFKGNNVAYRLLDEDLKPIESWEPPEE